MADADNCNSACPRCHNLFVADVNIDDNAVVRLRIPGHATGRAVLTFVSAATVASMPLSELPATQTLRGLRLRLGENVAVARDPHIQSGQQKYTHTQRRNQSAHNHDGERPLGIRPDLVRQRRRQQSERRH